MPLGDESTATRKRASARWRAVMSTMVLRTNIPSSVATGVSPISTGTCEPSLRRPYNSRPAPIARTLGSWKNALRWSGWFIRNCSGTSSSIGWPSSSSRGYPNSRSTSRLTSTMRPPASIIRIPAGDDSTAARSRSSTARDWGSTGLTLESRRFPSYFKLGVGAATAIGRRWDGSDDYLAAESGRRRGRSLPLDHWGLGGRVDLRAVALGFSSRRGHHLPHRVRVAVGAGQGLDRRARHPPRPRVPGRLARHPGPRALPYRPDGLLGRRERHGPAIRLRRGHRGRDPRGVRRAAR